MRHTCQVWIGLEPPRQCEEPAVDFAEIVYPFALDVVRVWMCVWHWDEHQKRAKE